MSSTFGNTRTASVSPCRGRAPDRMLTRVWLKTERNGVDVDAVRKRETRIVFQSQSEVLARVPGAMRFWFGRRAVTETG